MTLPLLAWAVIGLLLWITGGSHDVLTASLILFAAAVLSALYEAIHSAWLRNSNASIDLERNERVSRGEAIPDFLFTNKNGTAQSGARGHLPGVTTRD